ncbi:MAG: dihydropteroate synthase [Candidatus Omnitrophica bacterium]|nr:dihydropteroate synthase [Candidatus Omnitrophota bacterium]
MSKRAGAGIFLLESGRPDLLSESETAVWGLRLRRITAEQSALLRRQGQDCGLWVCSATGGQMLEIAGCAASWRTFFDRTGAMPASLGRLVARMRQAHERAARDVFDIRCRGRRVRLSRREPAVMGILNVTPDSFSDGGRFFDPGAAVAHGLAMDADGAAFIDIGAESTRPGARAVPAKEQLRRLKPVVKALSRQVAAVLSIDTSSAAVADACLEWGCRIVNDVSALRRDRRLAAVVAGAGAGVILMHMRGTPRTMQRQTAYGCLIAEIMDFLSRAMRRAEDAGIERRRMMVDPGIGFGKDAAQNLSLVRHLGQFRMLGAPLVVGTSRKSFIGAVLDAPVNEREAGTIASVVCAAERGAHILRVHDVRAARQAVRLASAIAAAQ